MLYVTSLDLVKKGLKVVGCGRRLSKLQEVATTLGDLEGKVRGKRKNQ